VAPPSEGRWCKARDRCRGMRRPLVWRRRIASRAVLREWKEECAVEFDVSHSPKRMSRVRAGRSSTKCNYGVSALLAFFRHARRTRTLRHLLGNANNQVPNAPSWQRRARQYVRAKKTRRDVSREGCRRGQRVALHAEYHGGWRRWSERRLRHRYATANPVRAATSWSGSTLYRRAGAGGSAVTSRCMVVVTWRR